MDAVQLYEAGMSIAEVCETTSFSRHRVRKILLASGVMRNRSNRRSMSDVDRFFEKTNKRSDAECWPWMANMDAHGYGKFWLSGRKITAQRAAFIMFCGPIPDSYQVDHLCFNPSCVNPAHLRAVTKSENLSTRRLSKTHCKNGHPLDADNIIFEGGGTRRCKICREANRGSRKVLK